VDAAPTDAEKVYVMSFHGKPPQQFYELYTLDESASSSEIWVFIARG
jgi:hypothetical protein